MSELVFATMEQEIKKVLMEKMSDPDLITLLYSMVAKPAKLKSKKEKLIVIDDKTASLIINRKKGGEVRDNIRRFAYDYRVQEHIKENINDEILSIISDDNQLVLLNNLITIIENDPSIQPNKRNELLSIAKLESLAFL